MENRSPGDFINIYTHKHAAKNGTNGKRQFPFVCFRLVILPLIAPPLMAAAGPQKAVHDGASHPVHTYMYSIKPVQFILLIVEGGVWPRSWHLWFGTTPSPAPTPSVLVYNTYVLHNFIQNSVRFWYRTALTPPCNRDLYWKQLNYTHCGGACVSYMLCWLYRRESNLAKFLFPSQK